MSVRGWLKLVAFPLGILGAFVGGRSCFHDGGAATAPSVRDHGPAEIVLATSWPLADFSIPGAIIIGANELVQYHPETFVKIAEALYGDVPLIGIYSFEAERAAGVRLLAEAGLPADAVHFWLAGTDTMWVRDYGPLFSRESDGTFLIHDPKYSVMVEDNRPRFADDDFPILLGNLLNVPLKMFPLRLAGGNMLSNGDGLCVTSTSFMRDNLNMGYELHSVGSKLRSELGYRTWTYLQPLTGEPTEHVDTFAAFLAPDVAVVGRYDHDDDPENARCLDVAAQMLARQVTTRGLMRVYRIPMPARSEDTWPNYCNIIFGRHKVLVPSFSHVPRHIENEAFSLYRRLLPDREIVPIPADSLARSSGLLRCCSVAIPTGVDVTRLLNQ